MRRFDRTLLKQPVPLFPLPNCVLLPGAVLPLHVFEPRFRAMTQDVVSRPAGQRIVGIALLVGDFDATYGAGEPDLRDLAMLYETNHAPIHDHVCVGEVVERANLPNGRFNVLVLGQARARILSEDRKGVYRKALLEYIPSQPEDLLATVDDAIDRTRAMLAEVSKLKLRDSELIDRLLTCIHDATVLIDVAAFHVIDTCDTAVKQRILEEPSLRVRAEILACYMERLIEGCRVPPDCAQPDRAWPPQSECN